MRCVHKIEIPGKETYRNSHKNKPIAAYDGVEFYEHVGWDTHAGWFLGFGLRPQNDHFDLEAFFYYTSPPVAEWIEGCVF